MSIRAIATRYLGAVGLPVGLLILGVVVVGVSSPTARVHPSGEQGMGPSSLSKPRFDAEGRLLRPDPSYRRWVYVGAPVTPDDLNQPEGAPFPEFHNVYVHPDDYDHYARTGRWRDGTVFVKELVSVGSKRAPSGNGYFMGDFIGLETAIKDSGRFPDAPGNWAYFSFGHQYPLAERAPAQPVSRCNVCHAANAQEDWVFTQYYPVLRALQGGPEETGGPGR